MPGPSPMTAPHIHRIVAMPGASLHLDTLAATLERIKFEHRHHDRDLGDVLGKSKDRAEAARRGQADISAYSLVRGGAQWGPGFLDPILYHAGLRATTINTSDVCVKGAPRVLTAALLKVIEALDTGDVIDNHELRNAAPEITRLGQLADLLRLMLATARP